MGKKLRVILPLIIVVSLTALVVKERRLLLLMAVSPSSPPLGEPMTLVDSVVWFDDYYTLRYINSRTIAIGEPRYHQANYSYLIVGKERAILFDSGPGVRDITPVVESLTSLPLIVTQSHLHYDHVGNHTKFDQVAMPDIAHLRNRAEEGRLELSTSEHLGVLEGFEPPRLAVSQWWPNGYSVDLGERRIEIIHTRGHTPDSMMLYDREYQLLFTGDFIYPGPLIGMAPGSDLNAYLNTAEHLVQTIPHKTKLMTAHGEQGNSQVPILQYSDLVDLHSALAKIATGTLEGEGFYLKRYPVNSKIELWAD